MKIVIDIPEEVYKSIQDNDYCEISNADMYSAVKNGTPLPKNHGDLMILSKDKLKENLMDLSFSCQKWISEVGLSYATVAIIEADKEYEVKIITRGNCMMCGKELTDGLFLCKECGEKANKESEEKV